MTNMQDILGAIAEANAQAQRVPGLEAQITDLERLAEARRRDVEARETSILSLKDEISKLNEKVRSLEVERDDNGFRLLEAEDRVAAMSRTFKEILAAGEGVLAQVDGAYLTRNNLQSKVDAQFESLKSYQASEDRLESNISHLHEEIASLNGRIASLTAPKEVTSAAIDRPIQQPDPAKFSGFEPSHEGQSFDHGPEQTKPWEAPPQAPSMPEVKHNPESEDRSYEQDKPHETSDRNPDGTYRKTW